MSPAMSLAIPLRRALKPQRPVSAIRDLARLSAARRMLPTSRRRPIHITKASPKDGRESLAGASTNELDSHGGSLARTDSTVQVEYPSEGELPPSAAVQGRGGRHHRRTLPSFSLDGRVGVVTGGARGLGLVMSQALVISGANVAIVDLNSKDQLADWYSKFSRERLIVVYRQRKRQKGKLRNSLQSF